MRSLILAGVIFVVVGTITVLPSVHGQAPSVDRTSFTPATTPISTDLPPGVTMTDPTTVTLLPKAATVYTNIIKGEEELNRQWQVLEGQRQALLIGAGAEGFICKVAETVVCSKPPDKPK